MVLQQDDTIKLLNTIDERVELLKKLGVENVVVKTFDKNFSELSAKAYVENILIHELKAKAVIIGHDHHFGKGRSANIHDLFKFGKEFNFDVIEIPAQDINNVTVSSTKIRNALNEGDVSTANKYLGYNYFINGSVIGGKKIGRTIAYRTANIKISESYKLIPKDGVYVASSCIGSKTVFGMMNIGSNPTIPEKERSIEIHFFNFNEDLYDKHLTISIHKRLRDELKFDSVGDLKEQLLKDEKAALNYIEQLK
jgi:riboflavin kinase/FMN adenylyltransferase